jgi:Mn-dependent DtxR family transcriptional regulator
LLPDAPFARKIQTMERQFKDYQMRTLSFIYDYIKSNGCAPNRKEIGEAFGISMSTAYDRIQQLFGHGCLRKSETAEYGRNIALTKKGISVCESLSKK